MQVTLPPMRNGCLNRTELDAPLRCAWNLLERRPSARAAHGDVASGSRV